MQHTFTGPTGDVAGFRYRFLAILIALGLAGFGRASAQVITETPIRTANCYPVAIVAGPDGALWFTESGGHRVSRIGTNQVITEYVLPGANDSPYGIAAGPDGALWFVDYGSGAIGRITTAGAISEFPVSGLYGGGPIVTGPDGALWFIEVQANAIGRLTTAGVHTEFPIPTPASTPTGLAVGPDGNLWFTETETDHIGRLTMAGSFTEFPLPGTDAYPLGIAAGSDGGLWFAEYHGNKIGRIDPTTGGVVEYAIPSASSYPQTVTAGADGAIWFTEDLGNRIGRLSNSGVITEYFISSGHNRPIWIARGPDDALWFTESSANAIGRLDPAMDPVAPFQLTVDSAGNGVLEPGETTNVVPVWRNRTGAPLALSGLAYTPLVGDLTVDDFQADYGSINPGATGSCASTGNCYGVTVANPSARPSLHWDALFSESVVSGESVTQPLHIGASFGDVPTGGGIYRFVETLLHKGVTTGCGAGNYCPNSNSTRAQMAVFLLVAASGALYTPPPCTTPVFNDVPCTSVFAKWVDELAARGVTAGCGNNAFCPNDPVTRGQMAVFLLRTREGNAYTPPACVTPTFADVPCTNGLAKWIEELARRGITAGCGNGNYCPNNPVTRGQMAVFLTTTFGLTLYGP